MSTLFLSLIVFMIMGLAGLGGSGRFLDQYMSGIPGSNNNPTTAPIQIPQNSPTPGNTNTTPTVPVSANCLTTSIAENFTSTALNQNLWVVAKDQNNIGKVEFFSGMMKASAGNSSNMSYAGLLSKQKACGDFEISVSLNNFTVSDGNEAIARLSVEKAKDNTPDFSNDSLVIEIIKKNAQYVIKTIHYIDEVVVDQAETDYPYNSTGLMLKRESKDISAFYNQNGIWNLLKKYTNVHNADSFFFIGVKSSISNPSVSGSYDDLKANVSSLTVTGTPTTAPPTSPPVLSTTPTPTPTRTITPTPTSNFSPTPSPTLIACPSSSSNSYDSSAVLVARSPSDPPAAQHPDINLNVRGYALTSGSKTLINLSGPTDGNSPQLSAVLERAPEISNLYQVYDWDWNNNRKGGLMTNYSTTMMGLKTTTGEDIKSPNSNSYRIAGDFQMLVLYATEHSLTLKYTPDDNVVDGYTFHYEGLCVDPNLIAKYNQENANGRNTLPALRGKQIVGTAASSELKVVVRDKGTFMDPRSRKDWWMGY